VQEFSGILDTKVIVFVMFICNYSAPKVRIIIAWGFAAGAGVYDVKALSGRIKKIAPSPRALPWALIKRPFRAE